MAKILVAGAGKIGSLISQLLASESDYEVVLIDSSEQAFAKIQAHERLMTAAVDVMDNTALTMLIKQEQVDSVVACLPYFCNERLLMCAVECGLNYFDLTEDVAVAKKVSEVAVGKDNIFMTRCGVAPGLINIIANDMMQQFDKLDIVKLRAGCLPKHVSNPLQYALAWSVDGLINEYGNVGYGIFEGEVVDMKPLDDIEDVELDGVQYEAFNTSGGIGALVELYEGKVNTLNYKTLRYPGHCEKMRFLMQDLHLNDDRDTLKKILLRALPQIEQDVMIVYVSVTGEVNGEYVEKNTVKIVYPKELFGEMRSAIQVTTASSAAAVIDIVHTDVKSYQGFVLQESMSLQEVMGNRFGKLMS